MTTFSKEHISPDGLFKSPAFSQAVTVRGSAKTIYIGGQNAVNAQGSLVGSGDAAAQTRQVLENIKTILTSQGATFDDVVKLNIHLAPGVDPRDGFGAFREVVGETAQPPLVTVVFVAGLANPEYLVEIDGVAVVADADA